MLLSSALVHKGAYLPVGRGCGASCAKVVQQAALHLLCWQVVCMWDLHWSLPGALAGHRVNEEIQCSCWH